LKPLLVLAGGFGKRLQSLVSDVPKPLAPVGDKPFIYYLIRYWISEGIKEIVFLLHYEPDKFLELIDDFSEDPEYISVKFSVIIEENALGTGGAILNAINHLNLSDSFLVANADTWVGSGLADLSETLPCTLAAIKVVNPQRFGALDIKNGKISRFQEKKQITGKAFVNSGLYHLESSVFEKYKVGMNFSIEQDIFPVLVELNKLNAIKLDATFIDIGIPADYLNFCSQIENGEINVI
jgi:D-glycero-alpha-D-manno-heptose 1-phosphate guanylyltransferase